MAPSLLQLDPLVPQLIYLCCHLLLLLHEPVVRVHPWLQVCCRCHLRLLLLRLQLGLERLDLGLETILLRLVLGLESIDLLLLLTQLGLVVEGHGCRLREHITDLFLVLQGHDSLLQLALILDFHQPVLEPLYVLLGPVQLVPAILGLVRPVARRVLPALAMPLRVLSLCLLALLILVVLRVLPLLVLILAVVLGPLCLLPLPCHDESGP